MIDTEHVGAPPNNTEEAFDAVPRQTHSLTLAYETSREVRVKGTCLGGSPRFATESRGGSGGGDD